MDSTEWMYLLVLMGFMYVTIGAFNLFWASRQKYKDSIIKSYTEGCDYLIDRIVEKFMKIGEIQLNKNSNIVRLGKKNKQDIIFPQINFDGDVRESSSYNELLFILENNLPKVIYDKVKLIDELVAKAMKYKKFHNGNICKCTIGANQILTELEIKLEELDEIIASLE